MRKHPFIFDPEIPPPDGPIDGAQGEIGAECGCGPQAAKGNDVWISGAGLMPDQILTAGTSTVDATRGNKKTVWNIHGNSREEPSPDDMFTHLRNTAQSEPAVESIKAVVDRFPPVDWGSSANSATSTAGHGQQAILPQDSLLADWFDYARSQLESADAFLAGAILPVVGGMLARRAWFQFGDARQYPNLFCMLAGKPGDRKSSVINLAEKLGRIIMPSDAFLPSNFSPETLFDAYEERADKIWIEDDANSILTDWQKAANGERVATRFLGLYDCKGLSESYRRNKKEKTGIDGGPMRIVPETSTNLLFGATFNICCFQGQAVRAGMARRFLYYVADGVGRTIIRPPTTSGELEDLAERFKRINDVRGPIDLSGEAEPVWKEIQIENRTLIAKCDPLNDALASRLSSAPMQTLHIAMIFEAARWARQADREWHGEIQRETLEVARRHVEECLHAADFLEKIATRAQTASDAESLFANIRHDFAETKVNGTIYATRTQLTRKYAPTPGRRGALSVEDLYHRLIPALERAGQAKLVQKRTDTKPELYAFRAEE